MVPLHLAETIQELKNRAQMKLRKLTLKCCLEKMELVNDHIKKSRLENDEEQEYVLLFRYLHLLEYARKYNNDFTKHNYPKVFKVASDNISRLESLEEILTNRYHEKKNNEQNSQLRGKTTTANMEQEKSQKDITNHMTAGNTGSSFIRSEDLYDLCRQKNNNDSYLIVDARSSKDFNESHLNIPNVINIPEEIILPGLSASGLGTSTFLTPDAKELWGKRMNVNKLILLDWNSTEKTLKVGTKLFCLRNTMTNFDLSNYKCKPLILEGGYEDVLYKYPHMTTNSSVKPPLPELYSIPSLDSFDYPIQVLEPEVKKKPSPPVEPVIKHTLNGGLVVDRSTKPVLQYEPIENKTIETTPQEKLEETEEDKKPVVFEPLPSNASIKNEEEVKPLWVNEESRPPDPPPGPKEMLHSLRKVKPDIPINTTKELQGPKPEKIIPDKVVAEKKILGGSVRVPTKKEDGPSPGGGILKRSSSSPNIAQMNDETSLRAPIYTRANKPTVYAERTDSTYGKTAAGLTGLKNFANNCYMNSILQCLSNTKPLVTELISINKQLAINYQSKTKGKIAQEVISAFRNIWSGDVKVYSIKDLKNIIGGLKEIFKGTAHQDSNEFLIILLEYLHDDLNMPASGETRLDGAREETGEKAWGEFRRKNCSIIQRLFYGQHRSTVTCSTCGHSSVTFEQFFNLFVPIPSRDTVTLNDCLQLYMSGEKISGWKCPKCMDERNATKKFDISRLPPILVIAFKRFTNEEDSWLQKKENLVTYPLEGLDMERYTVKGSEQRYTRYNLYAMSTHTGTLRAGHYKAICKNYITDKWYMFDDQSVEPLPTHSVQNIPEVYILFYSAELNC